MNHGADPATKAGFTEDTVGTVALAAVALVAAAASVALWVVVMRNEAEMVRRSDARVAEVIEVGDNDLTVRAESTDGEVVAKVRFDYEPTDIEPGDLVDVLVDRNDIHHVVAVGQRSDYNGAWAAEPLLVTLTVCCAEGAAVRVVQSRLKRQAVVRALGRGTSR